MKSKFILFLYLILSYLFILYSSDGWVGFLIFLPFITFIYLIVFGVLFYKFFIKKADFEITQKEKNLFIIVTLFLLIAALFNSGDCGDYVGYGMPNFFIERLVYLNNTSGCDLNFTNIGFVNETLQYISGFSFIFYFLLLFIFVLGL